ncbi:MAG TPA: hypothetical protein VKR06_05925 [Ktedonosporobacter sp.]|nr:hypothetical protein [Ktedonosporobacter sp.]
MSQQSIEERLLIVEGKIAELELTKQTQEMRDLGLLARIDGFIDDLRRIERVQLRGFDTIMAVQREQATDIKELKAVQSLLVDAAKDHKKAIDSLHTGQQQIIELLTGGRPRTND